jgi:hypothetical protein
MKKYLTLTDTAGQKYPIDLTEILSFDPSGTNTTRLDVIFRPITGNAGFGLRITHTTAPNAYAFQNWFVEEMERILSGNWREVEDAPTPPYAIGSISLLSF